MLYSKLKTAFFLLTLPLVNIFAQDTKVVAIPFNKSCPHLREQFSVLVSEPTVRHGNYASFYPITKPECDSLKTGKNTSSDYIRLTGAYENGKKQGKWTEFYKNATKKSLKDTISTGFYVADKKVGIWKEQLETGIVQVVDYDKNLLIDIYFSLGYGVKYPAMARENNIEGTVIVQYFRSKNGDAVDLKIVKSLEKECDAEALATIKMMLETQKKYFELHHLTGIEKTIDIPVIFSLH